VHWPALGGPITYTKYEDARTRQRTLSVLQYGSLSYVHRPRKPIVCKGGP
jgi:hypothetical protein